METKLVFANIYPAGHIYPVGQLEMYYNDNIWRRSMNRRQYNNLIVRVFSDHVIYRVSITTTPGLKRQTIHQHNVKKI